MNFQIIAILIMIAFYGIYGGKMTVQRKQGIETDQIAKGKKDRRLFTIEIIMKFATYSIVIVQMYSIIAIKTAIESIPLRIVGVVIGVVGVVVFAISVYTMRDSWRAGIPESDKTELVKEGIYKFSRNPAFLGFDLVYIGILLMFFSWVLLVITLFTMVILHLQILEEEKFLSTAFGEDYISYKKSVNRYIGRKSSR